MVILFLKILVWVAIKCRVYYVWSKVYQNTIEKITIRKRIPLPELSSLTELTEILSKMQWIPDGIFEFGDAIGSPEATWYKHVHGLSLPKDCDEIAFFAVNRIENMKNRGITKNIKTVGILSCPWYGENGTGGHNVCAFSYMDGDIEKWAWVGNWYSGKPQWDYSSIDMIVKAVCGKNTSTGFGLADSNLKLLMYRSSPCL